MPELPDGTFRSQAEFNFIATLPDGTKIWVLSASGPQGEVHLPLGRLAVPAAGLTSPLSSDQFASPGRIYLAFVDGLWSYVDSVGTVTPIGGGVDNFLALLDTPGSYAGQAGTTVRVNPGETALEFTNPTFLQLQDTPAAYAGQGLQVVRVNAGENALEFAPASAGLAAHHSYPTRFMHPLGGSGPADSSLLHWPGWTVVDTRRDGNQIAVSFPTFGRETDSGTGRRVIFAGYNQSIEEFLEYELNLYRGIPGNFVSFVTGITLWVRFIISGTPGGAEFTQINLEVYDPTNAGDAVIASVSRNLTTVSGTDVAYVPVTIPPGPLNAAGFLPGDMLRLRIFSTSGNFVGGAATHQLSLLTTGWG